MTAALAAEQQAPVARQHGAARCGRESFRRYVRHAAVTGQWLVWAEFAERAWRDLTRAVQEGRALANATHCANHSEARREVEHELDDLGLRFHGGISPPSRCFTTALNGANLPGNAAFAAQIAREAQAMAIYEAQTKANNQYEDELSRRMMCARAEHPWTPPARTVVKDSIGAWRKARKHVLSELEALGLAATVERTDGPVALDEHEADLAGLVRFHAPGDDRPSVPVIDDTDYSVQMAEVYRFTPHDGLPTTLRGFCGQFAKYRRLAWMDHAHAWLDHHGTPVLTVEPYQFDPAEVVHDLDGLPLCLDGLYPGVWSARTTLLIFRWDRERFLLTAEHHPQAWCPLTESWVVSA